ncbi:MAG TPA: FecR domain-containing protein [Gemmatimonadaceae bacterium]
MLRRRTIRLIARELAGLATDEERAKLHGWLAADPEHLRIWTVLREAWRLSDGSGREPSYDADADWPKVRARIDELRSSFADAPPERSPSRPRAGRSGWARRVAIRAAIAAGVLLVPWAAWQLARPERHQPAVAEVAAPRGATREAVLPDGSHVWLGAESSIHYAAAFDEPTRAVELRGMAYFEVVHDPTRPFLVHVRNGITTRVLGTHFVVLAYPESPRVEVAVAQGRVALSSGRSSDHEVAIGAGQVGQVGANGAPSVAIDTSLDAHFAWMRGLLVLEDRPLSQALVEIGRWYDARLKVEDPTLAARRISTTAGHIPLDDVLANITLALGARREQRGDTTVIVP